VFQTQTSRTDKPPKIKPSKTDLTEFEQQQFDNLMNQFKINLNEQKDGLKAIKNAIENSSNMVTTF
jgi:hypothetical protein